MIGMGAMLGVQDDESGVRGDEHLAAGVKKHQVQPSGLQAQAGLAPSQQTPFDRSMDLAKATAEATGGLGSRWMRRLDTRRHWYDKPGGRVLICGEDG